MNISRARMCILLTLGSALILTATGCEDSASKQRDEVRVQLAQIRSELQKTIATGGDAYDQSLNQIVTRLGSISGGEPGQQSAKSLLAADALREIAAIHMNAAAAIEGQQRADIGVVNARIDAALRLQSLASGLDTLDGAKRRGELQADLQKARDGVTALQARITELESPINDRNAQNTQQKQEIERLRMQVGDLLKQAQDRGYSAGLATFKEASDLGRQADKIELEVSNREIDLEHDLNPQHKMAQTQKAQLEALAQSITNAESELSAFSKAASGDAQTSRARAAEISREISDSLAAIKTRADGPLKTAYEQALAALSKAATNARTAATGGDPNSSKMISAAINDAIARVHLSAAMGIADRQATLERIKLSNGAIAMDGVDGEIKDLQTAHQEQIGAAKAALEEAKNIAAGLSGGNQAVIDFQAGIDATIAAVSGTAAPSQPPADPPAAPQPEPGDTPPAADPSAAPEATPAAAGEAVPDKS